MGSAEKTISVLARLQTPGPANRDSAPPVALVLCPTTAQVSEGKTNGHSLSGEATGFQGRFGESATRKEI